ncbi:hypothetical protein ACFQMH_31110 [Streptomyces viridiviolaceus]|uniref:4Fe-4S ferredoxin-type domain-containing protein n=1 Tax=Streptomyces viridiviolaceus TaxID=68282 RepID=A0ABW2EBJ4_9ACTN|nr:hypothetical protein [Streptomyces viridiviolaceus]
MTRAAVHTTVAAANPVLAHRQLGDLLARLVREADARVPDGRRARRTHQEMMPGYERQPVLTLHRPVMADDSCPLCGKWTCDPSNCPPASAAPAPATAGTGMQCEVCGGWFGVAPASSGPATAWTCGACQALGL